MSRVIVVGAVLGVVFASCGAQAQLILPGLSFDVQPTAAQQRAQVRPYILGLTNCVARRALEDDAAVLAFRDDGFSPYIRTLIEQCPRFENELSQAYDQTYGGGQGQIFIDGAYAKDLSRAVLARIRPQLQVKLDALRKDEAVAAERAAQEKAAAEAQARQAEAERQRAAAEAEQQAATARADAEKAKAQERAAAQVAEAERLKQVALATSTAKLLAVKALDCSKEQLKSLVKSGETAEVLANAVMTICGSDVDHFVDAGAQEYEVEHQVHEDDLGVGLAKEKLKAETRAHVVALAVQAKAGVGGFAPASSN